MSARFATALVLGYGLVVLAVGAWLARRRPSPESFYLADRNLGTLGVFASSFSTFLGTGLLFTLFGFGFQFGVGALALVGAAGVGLLLLGVAAPRINRMSARVGAITLPGMFVETWSARTRTIASLVTIGLFAGTLAANLFVIGEILETFLGLSPSMGIVGFGAVAIGYTTLGGFSGVVWTDLIQFVLIVIAFGLVLPGALLATGRVDLASVPPGHLDPRTLPISIVGAYLAIGLFAFFGSQDLFQRIFAAANPATARRGVFAFTGLLVGIGSIAVGLGIAARAVLAGPTPDGTLYALTEAAVPTGAVGLVVIGFLALANSDADSQALTVTSNVTQDLFSVVDVEDWLIDRAVLVGIGTVGIAVAIGAPSLAAILGSMGSWFAGLGVVVIATLYWDRMTDTGALAGLVAGFIIPPAFVAVTGQFRAATFAGLIPAIVFVVVGSWLTARRTSDGTYAGVTSPP